MSPGAVARLAANLEAAEFELARYQMLSTAAERDRTTDWLVRKLVTRYEREVKEARLTLSIWLAVLEKDHDT